MAPRKPKTMPLFTLCGDPQVSLVRVFSKHYWDSTYLFFPDHARFMAQSVLDDASFFKEEGHPVIQLACVEGIGARGDKVLGICSIVLDNDPNSESPWGELIVSVASVPRGKSAHLAVLRWFFFELCGATPWSSEWVGASTHRALAVPYPRLSSEQWGNLADQVKTFLDQHTSGSRSYHRTFERILRLLERYLFFGSSTVLPLSGTATVSPICDVPAVISIDLRPDEKWSVSGGPPDLDLMNAIQQAGAMIPEDRWEAWYEAKVPVQGDQPGDVCRVGVDIDVEPYALLQQLPPYLWDDDAFLAFVRAQSAKETP